jgi:HPt (histidine-containing phosphotransfer) domain-containing protein
MYLATTQAPPAILDDEQFLLCLTGEREIDQDLVRLAMIQCEEGLVRMAHAMREKDDTNWKQGAHRWRGSAGMLGFNRIAGLLHEAEYSPMTVESKSQSITTLHQAVEEVRQRLEAMGFTPPVVLCPPTT